MADLFQGLDLPDGGQGEARKAGGAGAGMRVMSVLVPYPIDKPYDYGVPKGMDVRAGDYVCVPLGGREVVGVVWGAAADDVPRSKLKAIYTRFDMTPMPCAMRRFIEWTAKYYAAPLGAVLKMALSAPRGLDPPKAVQGVRLSDHVTLPVDGAALAGKLSAKQRSVLSYYESVHKDAPANQRCVFLRPSELARRAGVGASVVKGLVVKGVLVQGNMPDPAPCHSPDYKHGPASLSDDQQAVADELCAAVDADEFRVSLLDGVTGAGKTEVYFEAIARALEKGQQVLLMLPEIALSNAFLARFEARFGCAPALWHSELTIAQRRRTWRGVAQGKSRVVVGARSALYLPYSNLGLIIVDEEHESAYKQEDGVRYHARDMAVVRAHLGGFSAVLVSATPSLETMQNVWDGRYQQLVLPARFGGAQMPDIKAIDLRGNKPNSGEFLAPIMRHDMAEVMRRGEQVLLFLNRRGYAPLTLCRSCGHRVECPRCTAWLVEHRGRAGYYAGKPVDRLECHHCGYSMLKPKACPSCGEEDSLVACGPGVERIEEEARMAFPDARIMVLASDTAETQEELRAKLDVIRNGEVDMIIGTQIVAKGHHFPNLTYVGVVDADLGLQGGELRASERVYQLLHQVAGRAGRAEKHGVVALQSYMPEHPILQALMNTGRDGFLATEAAERQSAGMPPFSRLVGVIVMGRDEAQALEVSKTLARCAPQGEAVYTLGPAAAPMAKLRGQYRFRLLVRAEKSVDVQKTVRAWVASVKVPSAVRVIVDVDPQSFM